MGPLMSHNVYFTTLTKNSKRRYNTHLRAKSPPEALQIAAGLYYRGAEPTNTACGKVQQKSQKKPKILLTNNTLWSIMEL